MNKILLITALILGCSKEEFLPQKIEYNQITVSTTVEIDQLTSHISLLILMNTNVSKEPFDDIYLIAFSNYLSNNVIATGNAAIISPTMVSNYILAEIEQGVLYNNISANIVNQFIDGNFEIVYK